MSDIRALKLRAVDDEDLGIIAACLHGAIGCLNEKAYDREARRFAAILVRPLWESGVETSAPETSAPETSAPETSAPETSARETSAREPAVTPEAPVEMPMLPQLPALKRMRAGLHFDHVNAVRYRRLDRRAPHALLHLISIVSAPLSERFGIILSFQGGGEVFLEVDKLSGQLRDLDATPNETPPQAKSPPPAT
ncbi:MAG: DUF2948 family protein [Proteobacteria bacterium]|nr:DUF2948 family protein [Pseudomonadota bacterium]